jgi:hypothetical protein
MSEKGFDVNEKWRIIHFDNGQKLTLHNVTNVDISGNYVRIMCDEGYVMYDPERVLYIRVPSESKVR